MNKCRTTDCKRKPTSEVMWPGEGILYYCTPCTARAKINIRAMGLTPQVAPISKKEE